MPLVRAVRMYAVLGWDGMGWDMKKVVVGDAWWLFVVVLTGGRTGWMDGWFGNWVG